MKFQNKLSSNLTPSPKIDLSITNNSLEPYILSNKLIEESEIINTSDDNKIKEIKKNPRVPLQKTKKINKASHLDINSSLKSVGRIKIHKSLDINNDLKIQPKISRFGKEKTTNLSKLHEISEEIGNSNLIRNSIDSNSEEFFIPDSCKIFELKKRTII